jgi:hypothetical protein
MIRDNPNASVSLGSGAGVGSLLVWALGRFGVSLDPVEASAIAGALSWLALYVGREGLHGIVSRLRWGSNGPPKPPATVPPAG